MTGLKHENSRWRSSSQRRIVHDVKEGKDVEFSDQPLNSWVPEF